MSAEPHLEPGESDRALIRRFTREQNDEAFSILMRRYADLVYTTSWRILGDESLAADAVQETFFQLARDADRITGHVGGWLHRVATRRAVDLVRQNAARRNREKSYALESDSGSGTWSEVEPAIDEAIEKLPDHLREVLLLHFLQGRSTIQIAAQRGVSQPTISRRLAEAIEVLRQKLRDQGIAVGTIPLQAVLLHSNQVAPEVVQMGLGKIALAKAVGVKALWASINSVPTSAKLATAVASAALVAVVVFVNSVAGKNPKLADAKTLPVKPMSEVTQESASASSKTSEMGAVRGVDHGLTPAPEPPGPLPVAVAAPVTPALENELPEGDAPKYPGLPPTLVPSVPIGDGYPAIVAARASPQALPVSFYLPKRDVILRGQLHQAVLNPPMSQSSKTNQVPVRSAVGNVAPSPGIRAFAPVRTPSPPVRPTGPGRSRQLGGMNGP